MRASTRPLQGAGEEHSPQRRGQFRRIVFQHLDVFLPARRRQQRDAVMARHHVHVQVEHDLPASGLAELLHGDVVGLEGLDGGGGDNLGSARDIGIIIGGDIEDVAGRAFGSPAYGPANAA